MKTITIFTTQYCGFCSAAKRLLASLNLDFREIDLTDDDAKREELFTKYNWRTVPAIFIGDEFVGGYDDIAKLHSQGQLLSKVD